MSADQNAANEDSIPNAPALLALDWGTSSLRAFLMDAEGRVMLERASAHGIQNLPVPGNGGFERAFAELCAGWLERWPGLPVVAGGMVGSAQGWKEAPYVSCPADTDTLASRAVAVDSAAGPRILIAPGVLYDPPDAAPDVMRGEEIQIAGALADHPDWRRRACIALPGTHSKWAQVSDGRIAHFATYMTGELFAVLSRHSILGRLMPDEAASAEDAKRAFADGVLAGRDSRPGDLPHQIFATRTLGLTGRLPHAALKDYLSGLLIGHELTSGLAALRDTLSPDTPLLLIGDATLCRRYEEALGILGVAVTARLANTAPRGLFQFARAAGLIA
ncbi:2-dehydro-3-deoxygalactonokinase [Azospirillum sp. SYSU D00513]|uniref:2-dehydro-3-deoxygalactonokinase n=1 Tax=Azospirillum sp. SYSU D00513 TaxID=2812561 RepID=UPI001A95E192|nr:2-dehydro-3-deoxygalactonokinase [Azospirillum sp. SYSU D00513]